MLLLGGAATVWGPVVGALVFAILTEIMTPLGPGRYLVTAVLIVSVLRFFPKGLAGIPNGLAAWRAQSRAKAISASTKDNATD